MKRRSTLMLTGAVLGVAAVGIGAFGVARSTPGSASPNVPPAQSVDDIGPVAPAPRLTMSGRSLDQMIAGLQTRLETLPTDASSWATLGIAYVQQAKATVNPDYYAKADGAIEKSLALDQSDNFLAYIGRSAIDSARHEFRSAAEAAEKGLAVNAYNPLLYGALSDAQIQLGNYDAGFAAVQKMVDLRPDTASLARASYTWELRGDLDRARELMQRAYDDAPSDSTKAFAAFYLGELAFNAGDPNRALTYYLQALSASPDDPAALAGRARAEAAIGQVETALDDYAKVVERTPEPSYLLEYGELLESLGRTDEAKAQYAVFLATQQLFSAAGVQPDATAVLFDADHGDAKEALAAAGPALEHRPFLAMQDAAAWAMHRNGDDTGALAASNASLALGMRNALFHYHRGMIQFALGDTDAARADLTTALAINPAFNPLAAPIATATLAEIGTT